MKNFIRKYSVFVIENPFIILFLVFLFALGGSSVISNFKLDFLAKFFNIEDLKDLSGDLELTMNFHDIIDLEHPEKSIEKLNESYFTELKVTNLSFKTPDFHLPLKDLDLYAVMDGHEAKIEYFDVLFGNSDLHINGKVEDLPAIIHHTNKDVLSQLEIRSKT